MHWYYTTWSSQDYSLYYQAPQLRPNAKRFTSMREGRSIDGSLDQSPCHEIWFVGQFCSNRELLNPSNLANACIERECSIMRPSRKWQPFGQLTLIDGVGKSSNVSEEYNVFTNQNSQCNHFYAGSRWRCWSEEFFVALTCVVGLMHMIQDVWKYKSWKKILREDRIEFNNQPENNTATQLWWVRCVGWV
jgi:hypothetical protein